MTSVATSRTPAPERRAAWAEGLDDLRAAATTEPGRLRVIGALLALLVLVFGAVSAVQVSDRSDAVRQGVRESQELSENAAEIGRLLAGVDTAAAENFLSDATTRRATRDDYESDLRRLSTLLVGASAKAGPRSAAGERIATISEELPRYATLVERAWADNRQGLPLGGAYLTYANEKMRTKLLPAARGLNDSVTERLAGDYRSANGWPWFAMAAGLLAVGALLWAQQRLYRRTHRFFNPGLLGATAATVVLFLWLAAGCAAARSGLLASRATGVDSLQAINEARIDALQARGAETLRLVARSSVQAERRNTSDEGDFYEATFAAQMKDLYGPAGTGGAAADSKLGKALALADSDGREPVRRAVALVAKWQAEHRADLGRTIGQDATNGTYSATVDKELNAARAGEQHEFDSAVGGGPSGLPWLVGGAVVLALLGAASAVWGIGRRVSEYR